MSLLETHAASLRQAMNLLGEATGLAVSELVALGYDHTEAKRIARLAVVYFGPTKHTRQQREVRANAATMTMNMLEVVEKHVRQLKNNARAWDLRKALSTHRGDIHSLRRAAKSEFARLNGPSTPAPARTAVSVSNPKDTLDRTIHLTGSEARITNLMDTARKMAKDRGINMAEAIFHLFEHGSGAAPTYMPRVVITLDDAVKVLGGEECDDIILGATDGARMTGAEFMQHRLSEHFECVLVDPVRGPISLGTARRRA